MKYSHQCCLIFGILILPLGIQGKLLAKEDSTRSFPAHKCRVTLPDDGWSWVDNNEVDSIFTAKNDRGFILQMFILPGLTEPTRVDEEFARAFETGIYRPEELRKRGGKFVTFRGLPTYQTEGILTNGSTMVARGFIAHGQVHVLVLHGEKEPIEKDPRFNRIMQSLEFTVPPEATNGVQQRPPNGPNGVRIAEWMGRIAGTCLFLAGALWLLRRIMRSPKTEELTSPDQHAPDEEPDHERP